MTQPTLFFSDKCPDTQPFVAGLEARGIRYDAVNITNSMRELKAFLHLRDSRPEFQAVKDAARVGVPVLLKPDGSLHFSLDSL